MQTLEINFKAVFENLPGINLLLLPDPPFFTVVGTTKEFSKKFSVEPHDAIGHPVLEIIRAITKNTTTPPDQLLNLIEVVMLDKQAQECLLDYDNSTTIKITFAPVPGMGDEVAYIIVNVTSFKKSTNILLPGTSEGDYINLHDIIDQAPVGMAIFKGEQMVLDKVNKELLNLWGKDESIIGLPLLEGSPEMRDQPFPKLLKRVYETGVPYLGTEYDALVPRNGILEKLFFNFIYSPLRNRNHEVVGIIVVASDVSDLVNSKKALEESEKRYRDLIINAPVATGIYLGEEMNIWLANDAMLKFWGKDASVVGKPLREAIPELEGQPFLKLLKEVYDTGNTYYSTEDPAQLIVNGVLQTFYFNFSFQAVRDLEGKIYGIVNMAVDVSDIVRAKNRINDSEERLRLAINSAELGTFDFYPLTNKLISSLRVKQLFGITRDRPLSFEKMINAIHERDRRKVKETIEGTLKKKSQRRFRIEYEVQGIDDHKERWQRATGIAFYNNDGVAYRLTGTVLDITDRKIIEAALEERVQERTSELLNANRELERSNRELEQYAYVASHDLQEPLRKILVYTDLLNNGKSYSDADHIKLEKIMASAQRMSLLIKDLLNFSKLLKTENIFSPVDLNLIVENVVNDFELKIQETNAVVERGNLPVVMASPQQMNQLFYNLISNGLKFMRSHIAPVIHIDAVEVEPASLNQYTDLDPNKSYVDITIADNGIGFNAKYGKQIFEIFKRLNTPSGVEGTGIGLALCKKIVLNHGGDIFAESAEGEGATFHVVLPIAQVNADAQILSNTPRSG